MVSGLRTRWGDTSDKVERHHITETPRLKHQNAGHDNAMKERQHTSCLCLMCASGEVSCRLASSKLHTKAWMSTDTLVDDPQKQKKIKLVSSKKEDVLSSRFLRPAWKWCPRHTPITYKLGAKTGWASSDRAASECKKSRFCRCTVARWICNVEAKLIADSWS